MATRKIYFSNSGVPATGLTLTWNSLKKASDGSNYTPQPSFTEIGGGWYKFNISPTEALVGVVDGSGTITLASERYTPIIVDPNDYLYDIVAVPVYNSNSDALTFLVFMLVNGTIVTDNTALTGVLLTVYDNNNVLLYTISGSSLVNGVFAVTKSSPALVANTPYYISIALTYNGATVTSIDTFSPLQ